MSSQVMTLTAARMRVTAMKMAMPNRIARHPLETVWLPRSKIKHCNSLVVRTFCAGGYFLKFCLVDLKDGDGGGEDGVDGKEDIWRCNRKNSSRMFRIILFLGETFELSFSVVYWY